MDTTPQTKPPKGNLLIVDDEALNLVHLESLFKNHFNIKSVESGEKALDIINNGFIPGVILSDLRMKGMQGQEFLDRSIRVSPNSVRVILTALNSPKDIIPIMNQTRAYMFITKPVEDFQLIQDVRVAFDQYANQIKIKDAVEKLNKLTHELNERTKAYKTLHHENPAYSNNTIDIRIVEYQ